MPRLKPRFQSRRPTSKLKKSKKRQGLRYLFLFLAVLLLGGYLFTKTFIASLSLSLDQVYAFLSPHDSRYRLEAILIRSAVVNQPHELIYLTKTEIDFSQTDEMDTLKLEITSKLGVPIDQVVVIPSSAQFNRWQLVSQLTRTGLRGGLTSFLKKANLVFYLLTAQSLELKTKDGGYLTESFLERSLVQKEKICSVAVINTTNINGLATRMSQLLEQGGVYVVRTGSDDQAFVNSLVVLDKDRDECLPTAKKLESLLPNHKPLKIDKVVNNYRTDIVLFLGKNLEPLVR